MGTERILDQRRLGRLRPRRQTRSRRRELCAVVANRAICTARSTARTNPTARRSRTKALQLRLWHNLGGGKFEDATQKAGFCDPTSKSLGIAILDYNDDGWPDILVANDTQPNKLYLNKKDGTFEERGVAAGIAFSEDGIARAGMGVDAADYDRSGHASILITNFANQMVSLYHNEGNGLFVDEAPQSEVGRASWSRWASAVSSSTTTTTAGRTSSSPTATLKTRSKACRSA